MENVLHVGVMAMGLGLNVGEHISAEVPDWSREKPRCFWDPGRKLLLNHRRYQYWHKKRGIISGLLRRLFVLTYRFWSVVTASDIDLLAQIGGGLLIPHPNGIVIHPRAKIGVNCLIHQQVTIGELGKGGDGVPVIEGHVNIYSGAKVLGPIRVGAHATIGANSLVFVGVPDKATVLGVPAKRIG
jgi:serine O-acetyltransferase